MKLRMLEQGIVYGSENPQKGDRSGYMPFFCEMEDGTLLSAQILASYFDAPDGEGYVLRSADGGKTFTGAEKSPFDLSEVEKFFGADTQACFKVATDGGDHVIAIGYGFVRNHGRTTIGNPETGGVMDCPALFAESFDGGKTFTPCVPVDSAWGYHTEASAPLYVLGNGDYVTPIAAMPDWDGKFATPQCGRLLRSEDKGKTWDDSTVTMDFGPDTTVWEQRFAVTDSGKIVDVAWNENLKTGELYNNHISISTDNGKTFGAAIDTGVRGQATGICALGGELVLTLHSMRKHVDRFGVLACIVDVSENSWKPVWSDYIWEPRFAMKKVEGNLGVFNALRFGQPSAIRLKDGTILYTQWLMENEVCRTIWIRFALED